MKKVTVIIFLIALLCCICSAQNSRRGNRRSQEPTSAGAIDSVINTLFPGSSDTPILTRIFNKFSYYLSGIVVSIVGYFAFFRNKKKRNETINSFLGEWQEKMALNTDAIDKEKADKVIYELNFKKDLKIEMKSQNLRISQNVQIHVETAEEDSPNLYKIIFQGTDPEGKSSLEGYAAFAENKMQIALAQTHDKYTKKE